MNIEVALTCAATPEQVVEALETNKLVTPDANVMLDDWAYRLALKSIKAQAAKLAKVRELRDRLQQTMLVMTDGNRAWATTIVHELTAILEAE